jgi:hypothetical protein
LAAGKQSLHVAPVGVHCVGHSAAQRGVKSCEHDPAFGRTLRLAGTAAAAGRRGERRVAASTSVASWLRLFTPSMVSPRSAKQPFGTPRPSIHHEFRPLRSSGLWSTQRVGSQSGTARSRRPGWAPGPRHRPRPRHLGASFAQRNFGATYSAEAAGTAEAAAVSSEAPRPTDETGNPAD